MWFRKKGVAQLDPADTPAGSDEVLVWQNGEGSPRRGLLSQLKAYIGSFGSIASQNADAVNLTGGTISGVAVLSLPSPSSPGDAAPKSYVDGIIAAQDAMVFKGVMDASGNPNYPAADRGWTYRISVAGKIGGASGVNVEMGDMIICLTDGTAAGTAAAVGANWSVVQANIDGAVVGPASAIDATPAVFDGATGRLLKNVSFASFKSALSLAKSDVGLGNVDNVSMSAPGAIGATTPGAGSFTTLSANDTFNLIKPAGSPIMRVGQSFSANAGFFWAYNANPLLGACQFFTYGYANSIQIDGSRLDLQGLSGGGIRVGAGVVAANGTVSTPLGAVGPTGSHSTVQEWIVIENASGTKRYIPAF